MLQRFLYWGDGGVIHSVSDYSIIVPSKDTPRVQEVHTLISHIICDIVEQYVAGALKPLQVAEQV